MIAVVWLGYIRVNSVHLYYAVDMAFYDKLGLEVDLFRQELPKNTPCHYADGLRAVTVSQDMAKQAAIMSAAVMVMSRHKLNRPMEYAYTDNVALRIFLSSHHIT